MNIKWMIGCLSESTLYTNLVKKDIRITTNEFQMWRSVFISKLALLIESVLIIDAD